MSFNLLPIILRYFKMPHEYEKDADDRRGLTSMAMMMAMMWALIIIGCARDKAFCTPKMQRWRRHAISGLTNSATPNAFKWSARENVYYAA